MKTATPSRMPSALGKSTSNRSPLTRSTVNGRNGLRCCKAFKAFSKLCGAMIRIYAGRKERARFLAGWSDRCPVRTGRPGRIRLLLQRLDACGVDRMKAGGGEGMTVKAIYENGVFRPTEPVNLPEQTCVDVIVPTESDPEDRKNQEEIYA